VHCQEPGYAEEFAGDKSYKVAAELVATERAYVDRLHLLDQVLFNLYLFDFEPSEKSTF